jgi:MFS family permease
MSHSNLAQVAVHDGANADIDAVWKAQSTSLRIDPASGKQELVLVGMILFLYLLLNVFTADRYPFPFFDEAFYTDPAVNYVKGHGFTANVPGEDLPVFYFYNGPAHPALLIPWLKIFGVSMRSVRSINFAYMAITMLLVWSAAKRLGLVILPRWRLLLVSMLICDYSVICSYRCGRYDCLGMLVVAFAFWSFSFKSSALRLAALAFAGAASPWIGVQLLPLEAMLGITLLAFALFRYWQEVVAFFLGIAAGGLGLIRFFTSHGVLQDFLRFVHSPTKGFWFVGGLLRGEFRHSNTLPKDFSLPLVLGSAVLLAVALYAKGSLRLRSPLIYGLIFVPLLGLTLVLAAHFPTYYGWMTYVPLAVCVCASLNSNVPVSLRRIAVGLCVVASIIGVGLHVLACARDWKDRDYSKLQQFVTSNIKSDDQAYIDPQAYYPAKLTGATTFFWDPGSRMSSTQKTRLTVCVIGPDRIGLLKDFGGAWYRTGQEMIPAHTGLFGIDMKWGFLSLPNYRLSIYRRVPIAETWSAGAAD